MKISVSSYSLLKYQRQTQCNYLDLCDKAKELGFDGIEFTDLLSEVSGKEPLEAAREIREHCQQIGLSVVAYTIGANFLCDDPQAEVARVKACVDVAAELGAGVMRHDACWALPKDKGLYTWREAVRDVAPCIREVTEYAATKGVKTCTENHGFILQDSERVETLIRTVNHPNYGWLIDMGNFICADEDSVHALGTAIPYAFHVHAKDFLRKNGAEVNPGKGWFRSRGGNYIRGTIVGNGVIPVAQCVYMLKNAGYEGFLSIEFEGMEDNIPALEAGLDYLRRVTED